MPWFCSWPPEGGDDLGRCRKLLIPQSITPPASSALQTLLAKDRMAMPPRRVAEFNIAAGGSISGLAWAMVPVFDRAGRLNPRPLKLPRFAGITGLGLL